MRVPSHRKCVPLYKLAVYAETFLSPRPASRKARDHGVLGQQSLGFLLPLEPCPELRKRSRARSRLGD